MNLSTLMPTTEISSTPKLLTLPISWEMFEFTPNPHKAQAINILLIIFIGIVSYALFMNSPIMAITFVLLGLVTYLQGHKPPRRLMYAITIDGVVAGNDLYVFDTIRSFWIIYTDEEQSLFLQIKGGLVASVRIPLGNMSPNSVREALLPLVKETKYEPSIIDTISSFLHI